MFLSRHWTPICSRYVYVCECERRSVNKKQFQSTIFYDFKIFNKAEIYKHKTKFVFPPMGSDLAYFFCPKWCHLYYFYINDFMMKHNFDSCSWMNWKRENFWKTSQAGCFQLEQSSSRFQCLHPWGNGLLEMGDRQHQMACNRNVWHIGSCVARPYVRAAHHIPELEFKVRLFLLNIYMRIWR